MTQQPDNSIAQPVSTVTKHIKIYSDNPIHDCIDRIINSCAYIDEDDDYLALGTFELREAAEDLLILATQRRNAINNKHVRSMNKSNPN